MKIRRSRRLNLQSIQNQIGGTKPVAVGGPIHFRPRRHVGHWHLADNRGTATICPLLDKTGHSGPPAATTRAAVLGREAIDIVVFEPTRHSDAVQVRDVAGFIGPATASATGPYIPGGACFRTCRARKRSAPAALIAAAAFRIVAYEDQVWRCARAGGFMTVNTKTGAAG